MTKLKYRKTVSKYTHFIIWKNVANLILTKVHISMTIWGGVLYRLPFWTLTHMHFMISNICKDNAYLKYISLSLKRKAFVRP